MKNNIHLFCYIDGNQENLIHHFIKYYKSIGIPISNWRIILHEKQNCIGSKSILNEEGINYEIIKDWNSDLKTLMVNQFIKTISSGWLIYADLDEWFEYESDLDKVIDECNKLNIDLIRGIFIERFAENFELKPITKESDVASLFNTLPSEELKKIIYVGQDMTKIMMIRISENKKPQYVNTHTILNSNTYNQHPKLFNVNHFRWSLYAKECLRNKMNTYINKGETDKIQYYGKLYFLIKNIDGKSYIKLN